MAVSKAVFSTKISNVPCNGCTACCRTGTVILQSEFGDDPTQYETEIKMHGAIPVVVLKRRPNGWCVYLGRHGCTIHDRAPSVCRAFDCREWVKRVHSMSKKQIKIMKRNGFDFDPKIIEAGEKRLAK